jgi:arabinan endo-1,5-alpha-L-arabinosidase
VIAAEDGRIYLVYHTRFQNQGEFHQVRVHQMFLNEDGWLVAAPFEYTGEQLKSSDIPTTQQVTNSQIYGKYKLLIHQYKLNHLTKSYTTPVEISLHSDGSITGDYNGTWTATAGTCYVTITLSEQEYKGVMTEQTLEPTTTTTPCFTALRSSTGVTIWGYKYGEVTGIDNVRSTMSDDKRDFYNLNGQKVSGSYHGIMIVNGKKYMNK